MKQKSLNTIFEYILPVMLLIYLFINTLGNFFYKSYTGINIYSNGTIVELGEMPIGEDSVHRGDVVVSIAGSSFNDFADNLDAPPFWQGYRPGEKVPVTVLRDGQQQDKSYTMPAISNTLVTNRLTSQWFMPYLFYTAGLMGLFFLRPRGERRSLFVLFNFLIATWFSASNLSGTHHLGAQYVLRAVFWLWQPVSWHFHWVFPRPLKQLPTWVLSAFYALCIFLAFAQVIKWVSSDFYILSFLLTILGSLGLLLTHIIMQPDFRRLAWQIRGLFWVLLIPVCGAAILYFLSYQQSFYFIPLALLGISALPGFYFFILYFQNNLVSSQRMQRLYRLYIGITILGITLGILYAVIKPIFPTTGQFYASNFIIIAMTSLMLVNFTPLLILPALSNPQPKQDAEEHLQIRANRLAGAALFTFLMLLLGGAVGGAILVSLPDVFDFVAPLLATLVVAISTVGGYNTFQRWFDARVLNIPIEPEKLLETYSERILTALDEATLRSLFTQEVLPSWLVRQFALLQTDGENLRALITLGVSAEQLPPSLDAPVKWARLSLPLSLGGKPAGRMLFGRRDPDDFYAANEAAVLQQVANLTALALANIKQAAALQELYQSDIERQESERTALAAELHDDVLQHMAILSHQLSDLQATPDVLETYQYTSNRIREITSGLRTPLLAYGLVSALEGLLDDAQDRGLKNLALVWDVSDNDVRLDERLELHLYRLAQQALNNALQHAHASEIRLSGTVSATAVDLNISDNGVGFAAGEKLDISGLLASKHFGVAGMFERAALIGAEMSIQSQPGQGCRVNVRWAEK